MTEKIEADYEQLEKVSQLFMQQMEQVEETISHVRNCMESLQNGGWIGRGAESFYQEMQNEVLPGTTRLKNALDESARITKQISAVMSEAEEDAGNRFKNSNLA